MLDNPLKLYNLDLSKERNGEELRIDGRFMWISGEGKITFRVEEDKSIYSYTGLRPFFMTFVLPVDYLYVSNAAQSDKSVTIRLSNTIRENIR